MEKITNVNDELRVKEKFENNRVMIYLLDGETETLLLDEESNQFFSGEWVKNDDYIVAYSIGCMINQIPATIKAAYSIKDKKFLDVTNEKINSVLEDMLIYKKRFNLAKILTVINKNDLGLLIDGEKNELVNYLTAGNEKISYDMVVDYILKTYPKLRNYTNLRSNLSVAEYRMIEKEFLMSSLSFHAMNQDLKFVNELENSKKSYLSDAPKVRVKKRV